jgi:EmrB/QacA subfamily drug resistance transporter
MSFGLHASCDAAYAKTASHAAPAAYPNLVLATTVLASGLAFVDGSVVNVGLPAIRASLRADAADLQWVVNAYLLPLSALLLFGGAAGDRFGRRLILILGTALFGACSLLCAIAPDLTWLLIGRALQGAGAALLMPCSLAILGESFEGEARGRAIGIWAASGAIMGAVGPVIGGWLIDVVSWRAIFLINIPLALAAIALALAFVREPVSDGPKQALDIGGSVLATAALGALTFGLTIGAGPAGWTLPAIIAVASGVAFSLAFAVFERRLGDRAMVPLALFSSANFVGLSVLTLLIYGALGGLLVLLPYVLIESARYSATAAGAALLPFPIVMAIASPAMGAFAGRTGPKVLLVAGSLGVAAGFLLLLRVGGGADYWADVFPALLILALGMSGTAAPLTTAVLGSVDERHTGAASGLNSALARSGGLVVTALLGVVLSAMGSELIAAFHLAVVAGAIMAAAAGLCAALLIGDSPHL